MTSRHSVAHSVAHSGAHLIAHLSAQLIALERVAGRGRWLSALLISALLASACGGPAPLPPPRPLIVSSGARLVADRDRMVDVHDWVTEQFDYIEEDPSFRVEAVDAEQDSYPWETLVIQADTARVQYNRANPDVQTSYIIYAHFHLMRAMGMLDRWLPEAWEAEGYALERAIVKRVADSWLLGRAIFDAQPHPLMDELIYANEGGFLDAFLLTARPDEFDEERAAWLEENPEGIETYREWFRNTLGSEPPGIRPARAGVRTGSAP